MLDERKNDRFGQVKLLVEVQGSRKKRGTGYTKSHQLYEKQGLHSGQSRKIKNSACWGKKSTRENCLVSSLEKQGALKFHESRKGQKINHQWRRWPKILGRPQKHQHQAGINESKKLPLRVTQRKSRSEIAKQKKEKGIEVIEVRGPRKQSRHLQRCEGRRAGKHPRGGGKNNPNSHGTNRLGEMNPTEKNQAKAIL